MRSIALFYVGGYEKKVPGLPCGHQRRIFGSQKLLRGEFKLQKAPYIREGRVKQAWCCQSQAEIFISKNKRMSLTFIWSFSWPFLSIHGQWQSHCSGQAVSSLALYKPMGGLGVNALKLSLFGDYWTVCEKFIATENPRPWERLHFLCFFHFLKEFL